MAKRKYRMGIDLGGTKMLVGVMNQDYRVLGDEKEKVEIDKGEKYFFDSLKEAVSQTLDEAKVGIKSVRTIGVGCPGIIDFEKGVVVSSPNIPFLKDFPLAQKLKKVFDVPIVVENDVNAGLYGEYQFGAAKGSKDVIGIFIGTGIGGALILNGSIHHGVSGAAGEIGHMIVDPLGPVCGCGARGCLEALAGRVAIAAEAAVLAIKQKAPKLYKITGADLSKIKSKALAKAIQLGDTAIKNLMKQKARLIGRTMANLVNVISPEKIVLGGGVVEAMEELIVSQAEQAMHEYAMPALAAPVKVVGAKLKDYAIVKGAAKLAADHE